MGHARYDSRRSGAVSRLQPHPPNFTPIGAIVLFGGAHFASRWEAFLVPLAAMVFSDAIMAGTGWHRSYMSALP